MIHIGDNVQVLNPKRLPYNSREIKMPVFENGKLVKVLDPTGKGYYHIADIGRVVKVNENTVDVCLFVTPEVEYFPLTFEKDRVKLLS